MCWPSCECGCGWANPGYLDLNLAHDSPISYRLQSPETHAKFCFHSDVYTYSSDVFGAGSGPIVLSNLNCRGSETSLLECSNSSPYSCSHSQDVGIQCEHRVYSGEIYGVYYLTDPFSHNVKKRKVLNFGRPQVWHGKNMNPTCTLLSNLAT